MSMLLPLASSIAFGSFPVLFRAPSVPRTPIPLLICTTVILSIANIFIFPLIIHLFLETPKSSLPIIISLQRAILGVGGVVGFLVASWYAVRQLGLSFAFPIVFSLTSILATFASYFLSNHTSFHLPVLIASLVLIVLSIAGLLVCRYLPNAVWVPHHNDDMSEHRQSLSSDIRTGPVFIVNPELMRHGTYDVSATVMWRKITGGLVASFMGACCLVLVWWRFLSFCHEETKRHGVNDATGYLSAHILRVYLMEQACIFLGFSVLTGIITLIIKGILEKIRSREETDEEEPLLAPDEKESFTIEFTEDLRSAFVPGIITGLFFGIAHLLVFWSILTRFGGVSPIHISSHPEPLLTVSTFFSSFTTSSHFSSSTMTWIQLHFSLIVSMVWGWFYLRDMTVRNELEVGYFLNDDDENPHTDHFQLGNVFFPPIQRRSIRIGCGIIGWRILFIVCLCALILGDILLVGWSWY